jgi:hypothetical protein
MTLKLKKNMKIASALMKVLGMVMHAGRRINTEIATDDKHAIRLIARANIMGPSNKSFLPYVFQPVHSSSPKTVTNGSSTVHSPIPKLSAS